MSTLAADTASTATSYTDATATTAGETYVYQVKAIRGEERSQASGRAQVQVPHDPVDLAPTGLTALILTASVVGQEDAATEVGLTWTAPAEDADSVTGYEVLRAAGEGELTTLVEDTGSTATSYADATATAAGETYTYQVKAIRGEERSQASGQARVQLPLDAVDLAPSNLTAEAVDSGVNLSWTAPAEDAASVTGYEILRAVGEGELATLAADTGSTGSTYTDATATEEGETYAYQVKAIRGQARSQVSNRVALIPVEPPATPENLAPSNLTFEIREDGVTLSWDAPAADADSVTGYRVVRRRPNQGENELLVWKSDTGSAETTYKDGYAQTHGEYYVYRVRALRGDEYSRMTNFVQVRRPEAAPETTDWAPSNLEALMYLQIEFGEGELTTEVKLSWDAPAEGTEWIRGYEVHRATCDGDFTALVSDTGSTATAYTDASAEAGERYTYRVRARRPQGLSLWTNWWTALLPGGAGEGACGVPAGATGTPVTPGDDTNSLHSTQGDPNLFAPQLSDRQRVIETDEDALDLRKYAGFDLHADNANPKSVWSDGVTLWVGDDSAGKVFAYKLYDDTDTDANEYGTRDPDKDVGKLNSEDFYVTGHGSYLYVGEESVYGDTRDVFAYNLAGPDARLEQGLRLLGRRDRSSRISHARPGHGRAAPVAHQHHLLCPCLPAARRRCHRGDGRIRNPGQRQGSDHPRQRPGDRLVYRRADDVGHQVRFHRSQRQCGRRHRGGV